MVVALPSSWQLSSSEIRKQCFERNCSIQDSNITSVGASMERGMSYFISRDVTRGWEGNLKHWYQAKCRDVYRIEIIATDSYIGDNIDRGGREDGLSCRHGVKPPPTHSLARSLTHSLSLSSASITITVMN